MSGEEGDTIREVVESEIPEKDKKVKRKFMRWRKIEAKTEKGELPQVKKVPYPLNPKKKDKERQYTRFLDIFKRLQISVPFIEAMEEMPVYAKFLKDLITRKKKYKEELVELQEGCSAIIQKRNLPHKSRDPGSFTIPVTIGSYTVGKALLDLGASINLMPLSMVKRFGDIEVQPTRMTLQLADRSLKLPYGIAEDVLVRVDKFVFPVDFVIMDICEDNEVPLILGRPFLKTARAIIDVDDGSLKLRVHDEEITFDVLGAIRHPKDKEETFQVGAKLTPRSTLHIEVEGNESKNDNTCLEDSSSPTKGAIQKVEGSTKKKMKGDATPIDDQPKQPWPSGEESSKRNLGARLNNAVKKVSLLSCFKPP